MKCINLEASEGNNQLLVSFDDEDEITNDEMEDFIDDGDQQQDDVSFYRQLDPENIEHYKFPNQTTNPKEAIYEDDEPYCGSEETHSLNCIIPKIESLLILINFMDLKNLSRNSRIP